MGDASDERPQSTALLERAGKGEVLRLGVGLAAEAEVSECRRIAARVLESRDTETRAAFRKHFEVAQEPVVNGTGTAVAMLSVFIHRLPESEHKRLKVTSLLLTAVNFQLTSFKLFMSGYTVASGALFRQAIEGVSLAVLCSVRGMPYLDRFEQNRYSASNAVTDLARLHNKAGISSVSVNALSSSYHFYHNYAHLTKLTVAAFANFSRGGVPEFGAFFDEKKIREYRKEVSNRQNFARVLPNVAKGVCKSLAQWSALASQGLD